MITLLDRSSGGSNRELEWKKTSMVECGREMRVSTMTPLVEEER